MSEQITQERMAAAGKGAVEAIPSIFLVMTDANPGQEDEFNDWYTNIHCHDIMRLKGSIAVQRFKLSPYQLRYNAANFGPAQPYLCIYELGDTQQNIDDHVEQCFSDAMPITSALRLDASEDFYYLNVDANKNPVESYGPRGGHVLTIRMNVLPGKEAEFEQWYTREYLPRSLRLIGFESGDLYRAADIQLVTSPPTFAHSAVYHVADPMVAIESLDSHLAQAGTILDCPLVDRAGIRIAVYSPITSRLTAEQVRNQSPEQQALEDRIRAGMAGRRHMNEGAGMKLKRD